MSRPKTPPTAREDSPGVREGLQAAGRVPISRYSFETVELFKQSIEKWQRAINEGHRAVDPYRPNAAGSGAGPDTAGELQFYPVELNFDALPDEAERKFFKSLPTSFKRSSETVDRLRTFRKESFGQMKDEDANGSGTL